jgi:hypothetical protein
MTTRQCADCRNGEHENYDDNIVLTIVRDPDTKKIIRRAYMCSQHRILWNDDGYEVLLNR